MNRFGHDFGKVLLVYAVLIAVVGFSVGLLAGWVL